MKSIKVFFCLLAMLCVSLYVFCEEDAYQNEREQKALKMAYELLKVYYPDGELCVSDSIWDEYDWESFTSVVDEKDKDSFDNFRMNKEWVYDDPVYSPHIAEIFKSDTCDCQKQKFVVDFTKTFRGYFMGCIMPPDRQLGICGSPTIHVFLFKYDENGEIVRLSRQEVFYD